MLLYIIYSLALVFFGACLVLLYQKNSETIFRFFSFNNSSFKRFWFAAIILLFLNILVYYLIFRYSGKEHLSDYLSVAGQTLTIVFGMVTVYLAFRQIEEAHLDRLKTDAYNYLVDEKPQRAKDCREKAYQINPKDIDNISELSELYLIMEKYEEFERKFAILNKLAIEKKEKIVCKYLKISFDLLQGSPRDYRNSVKELIEYLNKTKFPTKSVWSYLEMQNSPPYINLGGEAKVIFENVLKYLEGRLDDAQKEKFERGDYILTPIIGNV
jgi:tetratricopeptide (TPR) repeat protein